ncbi:hypothetical protein GCM10023196_084340 [Actinoallomurus vinaceus]|uniref:Uncharacterized protein n=1 Tax=Actinoallomurus vinaceus TaxID=1080074 RepID=A0ABP8UR22_9ACTN
MPAPAADAGAQPFVGETARERLPPGDDPVLPCENLFEHAIRIDHIVDPQKPVPQPVDNPVASRVTLIAAAEGCRCWNHDNSRRRPVARGAAAIAAAGTGGRGYGVPGRGFGDDDGPTV